MKKIIFILSFLIVLFFISFSFNGCRVTFKDVMNFILGINPDTDTTHYTDPNDPDHDGIIYITTCDGTYVLARVCGTFDRQAYVWTELEQNGRPVRTGYVRFVDVGGLNPIYLRIPLNGLNLDTSTYEISFYCDTTTENVGNPNKSIGRYVGLYHINIPIEVMNQAKRYSKYDYPKTLSDDEICILSGETESFTVQYYGDSTYFKIVEGLNNSSDNIIWSVGGTKSYAGTIDSNGDFTALSPVYVYWECYIIATDTIFNISDSLVVIINPKLSPQYACDPDSLQKQKHAGIHYIPGDDLIGASAKMTSKFGALCNSDTSFNGFSVSWVAAAKDTVVYNYSEGKNDSMIWAQTGYIRRKFKGSWGWFDTRYYEMNSNMYKSIVEVYKPPLTYGSIHKYSVELDTSSGKWSYYFDQQLQNDFLDTFLIWQQTKCNRAVFSGEILNTYDDMPGTVNDKNEITECQIKPSSSSIFIDTDFSRPGTLFWMITNTNEWRVDTTGNNSLVTWDVNPQL